MREEKSKIYMQQKNNQRIEDHIGARMTSSFCRLCISYSSILAPIDIDWKIYERESPQKSATLYQSSNFQRVLNDDLLDIVEYVLHVIPVRGARKVRIDLFVGVLVSFHVFRFNEAQALIEEALVAAKVREAFIEWDLVGFVLLLEEVALVEEQNEGGIREPARIANLVKEVQLLLHHDDALVLEQHFVVRRQRGDKDDGSHILKAMDPFLAFVALSA
eukprot:CAMPEP_0197029280 /NCGR_PEP_ID=MMETSP1384-20130603/8765_1 /TAXON_ID=29189 /ORGANISM="Ammonia sp." /LENGTH=217 /DNA_ID=CAMNT_0042458417 /DNA_START=453 /DNA_END=1103 /DNA_ORIENTATION=+